MTVAKSLYQGKKKIHKGYKHRTHRSSKNRRTKHTGLHKEKYIEFKKKKEALKLKDLTD
jgi:hypothetical protein